MHNVFSEELARRRLSAVRLGLALSNPTRLMRVCKEHVLAASPAKKTFVAVSEYQSDEVRRLVKGRHDVVSIPNAIDGDRFRPTSGTERTRLRETLHIAEGEKAIGFVGHEFKRKGLPELLLAMKELPAEYRLFIAGGASQNRQSYEEECERLGISDRVRLLGPVDDIPTFLAAMDVFCLPSHYEGTPIAALEALSVGLPVVLSEHCPVDELLQVGINGFSCRVEPHDIADALGKAAGLRSGPARIRETVAARTWEVAAEAYLAVIERQG